MPESTRQLLEYHPDKAKKLLAEAGYPNGFKTEVVCHQGYVNLLSIVQSNLAGVGIDMELKVYDQAAYTSIRSNWQHKAMVMHPRSFDPRMISHLVPKSRSNAAIVDDPYYNERIATIWAWKNMDNKAEQARLIKEIILHVLNQCYMLPMPCPSQYIMWWPWVENYHGETNIGTSVCDVFHQFIWIDPELRKSMGY